MGCDGKAVPTIRIIRDVPLLPQETDIVIAALTMTSEREEVIDFVAPYFDQSGISIGEWMIIVAPFGASQNCALTPIAKRCFAPPCHS